MGTINLSDSQQRKAEILSRTATGGMSRQQAAQLLHVSERQVRRLLMEFASQGLACAVHGSTGRTPPNKTPASVREKLAALAGPEGKYHDFNTCHLNELLAEQEGITLGRSTLDRLLKEAGVRKRRRGRPRRVFQNRERRAREGEMQVIDACLHDWLEGRDPRYPKFSLIGAVDDATGALTHLRFWPSECLAGYLTLAREVTVAFGVPMSFYHDRHTILCSPKEPTIEDELACRQPMSQFQKVLSLLGAEPIQALSPQAKGKVEQMWKTLQDRLLKEMRLAGINTLEGANAFLPAFIERFNSRFQRAARDPEGAWVKLEGALDLAFYFAAREERTVKSDHTLSFHGDLFSIERKRGEPSLAGRKVNVHTTPEGERFVYLGRQRLVFKPLKELLPKAPTTPSPKPPSPPEEQRQARRRQMAHLHAGARS